jgi:hypothetical protein
MQFIPAKERFSTNLKSLNIGVGVMRDAVSYFGRRFDRAEFRRLSGGFMNANYLAVIEQERIVVRGRALPETVGEERTEGGRSVRKNIGGVVPRVTIRADGRVSWMRDPCGEES